MSIPAVEASCVLFVAFGAAARNPAKASAPTTIDDKSGVDFAHLRLPVCSRDAPQRLQVSPRLYFHDVTGGRLGIIGIEFPVRWLEPAAN